MKGGQHQVTGFRDGDRCGDGLEVSHLADQQHIRRLAQGRSEGIGEGGHVRADLALLDNTALVAVHILDRILDRDDVAGAGHDDVVQHRRQRRRFAGAGRPGHEDEALTQPGQAPDHHRHPKLIVVGNLVGNQSQRHGDRPPLLEGVDTKARLAFPVEGEIQVAALLEGRPTLGGEHLSGHLLDLLRTQRIGRDRHQGAVFAHVGRGACRQDQVGRRLLQQDLQVSIDDQGMWLSTLGRNCH